jgi:thioesterase domain-containing protein
VSIATFLHELRNRDIWLRAEGEQLRCSAPAGALTAELRELLRLRKSEILEFLRAADSIARQPEAIVPLRAQGRRVPVFALGGHNGDVYAFRDLARHLGEDQPFFGLWPPGLDGHSEPLARIEDLAAYFAAQMRSLRRDGPYIIAGYCGGGAAAFELARQLAQGGAQVSFLALFGCPHPTLYRFNLPYWSKRVLKHTQVLAALPSFDEQRKYVAGRIRARLEQVRRERNPQGDDPVSLMKFKFEQVTLAAVRSYTPGRFTGRVCLFIPNRQWWSAKGAAVRWRSAAPRTEDYYGPDSVDPDRMLDEPHAPHFAELFKRCCDATVLEEARA